MPTRISPMLAVNDPKAAIAFYERAFGATIRWHLDHAVDLRCRGAGLPGGAR